MSEEFDRSELGNNETVIVTSPYGTMPTFDPNEIHIQECPVQFYGHGATSYIVAARNLRPDTEAWEWFKDALGFVGSMPVDTFSTLLAERSKYALAIDYRDTLHLLPWRSQEVA